MNPTKVRCPHCGSSIEVKRSGKTKCRVCGAELRIEEEKPVKKSGIAEVNYGRRMSSELFAISMTVCALASIFFILLPILGRRSRKKAPEAAQEYETHVSAEPGELGLKDCVHTVFDFVRTP